ncbi:YncE family protein [Carboxylicivirga linearis]|uniref:YncE family protein n=1 Tax=Carboxylicivirga linearis TaxID=1628157 RepID=A0ABS5JSS4_9BACT|nr:DUF5074 domain-containing protein [Carboxylicivirga linearis]MBS2097436.1 hypothetical protein [Carboxylicivirga linearis]
MKSLFKLKWAVIAIAAVLASCSEDDPTPSYPALKGTFVISEGSYGNNNGAIGFYNDEVEENDLFNSVNGRILGDVVQDFTVVDTLGFIVANNSQKVEVVRMRDFVSVATLDDAELSYPRFVKQATENTIYISNGSFAGQVLVYNIETLELTGNIAVGNGPEMMVKVGDKMYVANSGGWDVDNTISVIDITEGKVIKTITVGQASVTMKADKDNNLWVYSKGSEMDVNWNYTNPQIFKVNTITDEVTKSYNIGKTLYSWGSNLLTTSDDGYVYYFADATYKMGINDEELPVEAWTSTVYYGIEINPENGNVYCMDAINNEVVIMDADDASVISSLTETATYPRSVVFSY